MKKKKKKKKIVGFLWKKKQYGTVLLPLVVLITDTGKDFWWGTHALAAQTGTHPYRHREPTR